MKLKRFGNTGLYVSEIALGTMTFGGDGFWKAFGALGQSEAEKIVGSALDAGINLIDTANVYSSGQSEEIVGASLRNLDIRRDTVVIATKGMGQLGPQRNSGGMSRYHLLAAIKDSLRRMQLEHVDLYQLHGFDPHTPIEEALRALDQMVRDGLVRYVGVSNWAAWQISKALGIAERLGTARPESVQAYYTVACRDVEREIVPMLESEKLALMVWSPLAGGVLSGKYEGRGDAEGRRQSFDFPPVNRKMASACVIAMREIATALGSSVAEVAISWLLHQTAVTTVIVGVRSLDQLRSNVSATRLQLSQEHLRRLAAVAPPAQEYPGWMLDLVAQGREGRQGRAAADDSP